MKERLDALMSYGIERGLFAISETSLVQDRLIAIFDLPKWTFTRRYDLPDLDAILKPILNYAENNNLYEPKTLAERDAFEALVMDAMMPSPNAVKARFRKLFAHDPNRATRMLYDLSIAVNYIKSKRLEKNRSWTHLSRYGTLQMTINLAKPEKDPKDIAKARLKTENRVEGRPKCPLCKENERNYHNARMNLRIVPIELGGETWHFQYSPYLYYHEHAIILSDEHRPMAITGRTFVYLFDFLDLFPDYFIGSNADLPIVGGSILNHDHFQGGKHPFPIEKASALGTFDDGQVKVEHLYWPLATIRLTSTNRLLLTEYAEAFLDYWRGYDNPSLGIVSHTGDVAHNTVTPIARKKGHAYQLDIILRNNRTTDEYPEGIFHPHADVQHIKKENIGLIEAMGLAILPGRLESELRMILRALRNRERNLSAQLARHAHWYEGLRVRRTTWTLEDLLDEVGKKFVSVLEDAGVFKFDQGGISAMHRLIETVLY
ncbi:MAG: galactose-1-phosphate uridylyltransferase [Acholeplasmataceae bacterium]